MLRAVELISASKYNEGQEHKNMMSKWCKKDITYREASEYIGKYSYRRSQ